MRDDLSHLPAKQQGELERATRILLEEFEKAIALGNHTWKRGGKIYKIILFGSYARSDWVDDPKSGYQSDFDLLVVVSNPKLTDVAEYWHVAEDRILRDETIERQVNIIVHDLDDVNKSLKRGEYFWADIVRDGIVLYELPGHPLAAPMPLSKFDAVRMAERYFDQYLRSLDQWLFLSKVAIDQIPSDQTWANKAAFNLHQATETAYACFLLTKTCYFPKSHNIKFLRSISENKEQKLIEAWPRATKLDRRRFELLKRAYVEARYSANYSISIEDLDAIFTSAKRLRDIVARLCEARIAELSRR
ncbi:HEPN domain-containing protein [Novosphingobium sp. G106]|uniref:HEPN domain-containing protein n=1 Tax=Novosphingobium sp. G106 TaxID=2849500 RepID=UPI001C2CC6DB|nr:HEPN domain-containing protein [Novosphingobium sp. G106]MBV1691412.1 HEPN domain-containing protein [Novosphingobium sp. G106]